jgi:urate oxidase
MARGAFAKCPLIDEISITMPNQHHLLANLSPFGLENANEVFVPTSEPFGRISATIARAGGEERS